MRAPFAAASKAAFLSKPRRFFISPAPAGRRIVCGFSFLQRIGKPAMTDVWFPSSLQKSVAERVLAGDESVLDDFRVEWAAVRQFELLQEADNLYIQDLEVTNFNKAYYYLVKMRAGGYRVTVITLGNYVEPSAYDELRILDLRLQDEITRLIHMIYLEEQSVGVTSAHARELKAETWNHADALPHIAMMMGAMNLFVRPQEREAEDDDGASSEKKKKGGGGGGGVSHMFRQKKLTERFLQIVDLLPQQHLSHDVAVGLALPEIVSRRNWVYIPLPEQQYARFQQAMSSVFQKFDHISLSALHEREDATREIKSVMPTMRGYGDRLTPQAIQFQREMASFACEGIRVG